MANVKIKQLHLTQYRKDGKITRSVKTYIIFCCKRQHKSRLSHRFCMRSKPKFVSIIAQSSVCESYPFDAFVDCRSSLLSGSCNLKQRTRIQAVQRQKGILSGGKTTWKADYCWEEPDRESHRNQTLIYEDTPRIFTAPLWRFEGICAKKLRDSFGWKIALN